ncbi:MAG: uroporphyrinogen-III C-methyltransferase [Porticoccaceae bacterium]|nr:uroporphyrinogen-III C-methyltransferase [Porticoccaceae bacterium]
MVTDKKTTAPQASDKSTSEPAPKKTAPEKPAASPKKSAKGSDKISAKGFDKSSAKGSGKDKAFPWLKTLLVFLLIAALGFAGWIGWTEWQAQLESRVGISDSLQAELAETERKLTQQQQLSRQTIQQQAQLIGQLESQLQEQLYSINLRLNSQAERILQLGTASRGDWLLSEAAYLIRLANQRLQVERSTENPLAILENVDTIFVQLNDPELLPVRRALAQDIAALRMAGKVDREGIFLELEAISEAVKQLSVIEPATASKTPEIVDTEADTEQNRSLLNSFERFSQKLGQLIVVQKRQQRIEPLLTSNEQSIIQNNLFLLIEQAQSALLREEQIIYSASLEKSAALLVRYFQLNSQSQALIERLNTLSERQIIQPLPDISGSIAAVQTMLNLRQSRITDGEQQK